MVDAEHPKALDAHIVADELGHHLGPARADDVDDRLDRGLAGQPPCSARSPTRQYHSDCPSRHGAVATPA